MSPCNSCLGYLTTWQEAGVSRLLECRNYLERTIHCMSFSETGRALPTSKGWRITGGFSKHQTPFFLLCTSVDVQRRRLSLKCQVKHKMSLFMSGCRVSGALLFLIYAVGNREDWSNKAPTRLTSTLPQSSSC